MVTSTHHISSFKNLCLNHGNLVVNCWYSKFLVDHVLNVVLLCIIIQFIMKINDNVSMLLVSHVIYTIQITIYNMLSVLACETIVEILIFRQLGFFVLLHKMATKMKTYQIFSIIKEKTTMNKNLLNDLAAGAGSVENPIQIVKILSVRNKPFGSSILADLWSMNLMKYMFELRKILTTAQAENGLKNFLCENY